MQRKRIIPSLLLSQRGLVKTRRFKAPSYVGDPINAVKIFNEKEVDELFLFDIDATRERRRPDFALIESIVSEAFMPVGYGGGVRSLEDARTLLRLGVEKISLGTVALENPGFVRELSNAFGAQCVVCVVDVKRDWLGRPRVHSHAGTKVLTTEPATLMRQLVAAGAGELVVQSVDRDGMLEGLDLELLASLNGTVNVPVLAAGGANALQNMSDACERGRCSGVVVGARFVYFGPHRAVLISYLSEREREALDQRGAA